MLGPCYVCGTDEWKLREGALRDMPNVGVVECVACGLVMPSAPVRSLINYEGGSMHDGAPADVLTWRREGLCDDIRRAAAVARFAKRGDWVLDFGCGAGGLIHHLRMADLNVVGIEIDRAAREFLHAEGVLVWSQLEDIPSEARSRVRVVTLFHVLEHLPDPRPVLERMMELLPNARTLLIEVPCSEDPLLTLFASAPFSNFTYWSHHEQLHSKRSLESLLSSVFDDVEVTRLQRYGLGNHLGWLSWNKPGGQRELTWLEDSTANDLYCQLLIDNGFSDTLWAHVTLSDNGLDP